VGWTKKTAIPAVRAFHPLFEGTTIDSGDFLAFFIPCGLFFNRGVRKAGFIAGKKAMPTLMLIYEPCPWSSGVLCVFSAPSTMHKRSDVTKRLDCIPFSPPSFSSFDSRNALLDSNRDV
jgi:hypothetical protein